MTQSEIDQLKELLEVLEAGDIETCKAWLRAAIEMAEKEIAT